MIKEIYQYREFLKTNVKKDIRGKYKGSFLGILWSFINPLLMTLVYAIVFPFILRNGPDHYVTFIVIAILPWNWFTTVMSQGTFTMIGNADIIKKVYFPREILPISVATSGLVNYFISVPIILAFLFFSGIGFSWNILWLPLIALTQYILTIGIILITSAINVYIRDLEYIVNFIVTMLFYGTPVLYSATLFPEKFRWILYLNPMTTIINSYRDIFYSKQMPDMTYLLPVLGFSILLLLIGIAVFRKLKKGFAEEV
jgi:ABC-type polysaccharide/polyol phosphate export permease